MYRHGLKLRNNNNNRSNWNEEIRKSFGRKFDFNANKIVLVFM